MTVHQPKPSKEVATPPNWRAYATAEELAEVDRLAKDIAALHEQRAAKQFALKRLTDILDQRARRRKTAYLKGL